MEDLLKAHGYELISSIGSGAFATCFLVFSTKYKQNFVCKMEDLSPRHAAVVSDDSEGNKEDSLEKKKATFLVEIETLSKLNHPNIVRIYDHFSDGQVMFIILEYCDGGSLDQKIRSENKLSHAQLKKYIPQILDGIMYCHERNIAHCDIKPANILIDSHDRAKIADFGLAQVIHGRNEKCIDFGGSFSFMAPEVMEKKPYDPFQADIWSVGVTLYQLAHGFLPFESNNPKDYHRIAKMASFIVDPALPHDVANVIRGCIHSSPYKRDCIEKLKSYLKEPTGNQKSFSSLPRLPSSIGIGKPLSLSAGRRSSFLQKRSSSPIVNLRIVSVPRLVGFSV